MTGAALPPLTARRCRVGVYGFKRSARYGGSKLFRALYANVAPIRLRLSTCTCMFIPQGGRSPDGSSLFYAGDEQ